MERSVNEITWVNPLCWWEPVANHVTPESALSLATYPQRFTVLTPVGKMLNSSEYLNINKTTLWRHLHSLTLGQMTCPEGKDESYHLTLKDLRSNLFKCFY